MILKKSIQIAILKIAESLMICVVGKPRGGAPISIGYFYR
jgi:hypothetical protein